MSPAAWGAVSAVIGPLLLFVTYLFSKREKEKGMDFSAMEKAVQASLDTTKIMQGLLIPLEKQIAELRVEVILLRTHVTALETQIKTLGHEPLPPPQPLKEVYNNVPDRPKD